MVTTMKAKFTKYHGMSAKELLEALSKERHIDITPPIDLDSILDVIGVKLEQSIDLDRLDTAGSVSIGVDGVPVIWINPLENRFPPRKRFTIAHEIGHLIKHIDPDVGINEYIDTRKTLNRKASYWDSKEYEANNFAAELLMPAGLLKEYGAKIIAEYTRSTGKKGVPIDKFISRMAEKFNVSEQAMRYRLKNIGAI